MKTRKQIEDAYAVLRRIIEIADAVDEHDILAARKTIAKVKPMSAALGWVLELGCGKEDAFEAMIVGMRESDAVLSTIIDGR